jgi:uncharacterized protein
MLTTELLISRINAGVIEPKALSGSKLDFERIETTLELFGAFHGRTRGELDEALREDEADSTDYRIRRGLAHLLYSERCEFVTQAITDPSLLRDRVFALSAELRPTLETSKQVLEKLAFELGIELGLEVSAPDLERSLYADLRENQVIVFEPAEARWLLERFNLAQAQGILYRASELVITAHRNDPGEYKRLFKYLKLFGLMHRIEGDPDAGYTIILDGPSSLFKPSTRYGVAFAKFLPALLNTSKWSLTAKIIPRKDFGTEPDEATYTLDDGTKLKSHYAKGKEFDSILEQGFSERFKKLKSAWKLEREVDIVDLGGTVMIPDFRLVHEDSRSVLLEIVGYWRPDYLKRKLEKLRRSKRHDIVIAISSRLNLGDEIKKLEGLEQNIIWFKGVLEPKEVLEVAERLNASLASSLT